MMLRESKLCVSKSSFYHRSYSSTCTSSCCSTNIGDKKTEHSKVNAVSLNRLRLWRRAPANQRGQRGRGGGGVGRVAAVPPAGALRVAAAKDSLPSQRAQGSGLWGHWPCAAHENNSARPVGASSSEPRALPSSTARMLPRAAAAPRRRCSVAASPSACTVPLRAVWRSALVPLAISG